MAEELQAKGRKLTMVVGFVDDKDINAIMERMPRQARYIFTRPSVKRGRSASSTAETAEAHGLHGTVVEEGVTEALRLAASETQTGDAVFVGGSTFVVADLMALI